MAGHGFKVLYYAFKEGLGFRPARITPEPIELRGIQRTVSSGRPITRLAAFKKFYNAVVTCPASGLIMTDPVIARDGYCYQRGHEPDPELIQQSNLTLKTARDELLQSSQITEREFVKFYQSMTTDAISLEAAIDPVLDAGCVRSEKMLLECMDHVGGDVSGNGARWSADNPAPSVYFRYIALQKAIVDLKNDLDGRDPDNETILSEIQHCKQPSETADVVVERVSANIPALMSIEISQELSAVIARDPRLAAQVLKYDINPALLDISEDAIHDPAKAVYFGAMYLFFYLFIFTYASWIFLQTPYQIIKNGRTFSNRSTYIELEFGIPADDVAMTADIKKYYSALYFVTLVLSGWTLSSTGFIDLFIEHSPVTINELHQNHTIHEIYFSTSFGIAIASLLTSHLLRGWLYLHPNQPVRSMGYQRV